MTRYGFLFQGSRCFISDDWERHEQALLTRLFQKKPQLFVNAGAHQGYYCALAQHFGIRTVAFEPHWENCEFLIRNMGHNGYADLILFRNAVGQNSGFAEFFGHGQSASLTRGFAEGVEIPHSVPLVPLDEAVLGSVRPGDSIVVLIDVEGAELDVLRSAAGLLAHEPKPTWIMELLPRRLLPDGFDLARTGECFSVMHDAGYRIQAFSDSGDLFEVEKGAAADLALNSTSAFNYVFSENPI